MIHRSTKTRSILQRYLREVLAQGGNRAALFDLERALWEEFPDLHLQLREHFTQVVSASEQTLATDARTLVR